MKNEIVIGARYKVTVGVTAGIEGILIAFDSEKNEAVLKITGGTLTTNKESISLLERAPKLPKKRKYIVSVKEWAVLDCLTFTAPKEYTKREVDEAFEEIDCGENTEDSKGNNVGWYDAKGELIIGIVDAASEQDAISMFNHHESILKAYELK